MQAQQVAAVGPSMAHTVAVGAAPMAHSVACCSHGCPVRAEPPTAQPRAPRLLSARLGLDSTSIDFTFDQDGTNQGVVAQDEWQDCSAFFPFLARRITGAIPDHMATR